MKTASSAHLSFTNTGKSTGIPVVLIHAFPMNKTMWDDQIKALEEEFRVITFDIRGLGQSKSHYPYTMEFIVDDLIELLDQLKIQKAVIGGLSMGGYIAQRAYQRNPERVSALILANTKSEADNDEGKLARYKAIKTIDEKGLPIFLESFLKNAMAPDASLIAVDRATNIAKSNSPEAVCAATLALMSRTDTTAQLKNISVPTLIVHGEKDAVIPMTAAQNMHVQIKNSKLVVIPNAGHFSNLENPEAFNQHLLGFLKELKA